MDIAVAIIVLVVGLAAEGLIVRRARERAESEDAVIARLARYAGRAVQ
jgi:hypothetical protein